MFTLPAELRERALLRHKRPSCCCGGRLSREPTQHQPRTSSKPHDNQARDHAHRFHLAPPLKAQSLKASSVSSADSEDLSSAGADEDPAAPDSRS